MTPSFTPSISAVPTITILCNGLTLDQRSDDLEEMVLEVSEIDSLTQGTAQYDAFEWLANVDEAQLCPDDIDEVEQRYIMAVLYYSTEGDSWLNCSATASSVCPSEGSRFLSGEDVCFWYGVSCSRGDVTGISIGKYRTISMKARGFVYPCFQFVLTFETIKIAFLQTKITSMECSRRNSENWNF
jgi:hypothetical protein